jgi:arylsulfatase A-like enzyme
LGALPRGVDAASLNLVVVTLDTTRADRIGCYGAKDVATPRLDALAQGGVRFDAAVSPMPLTLPAHCTLFTGLLPGAHGVRDNGGFKLAPEHVTLAEVLKGRGFATGGFVSAFVLDHRWGIAQGFDRYFDDFDLKQEEKLSMGEIQRPGNETVDHALQWIRDVKDKRFFAWIHLYDPHAPYDPPEPYKSRYTERPYDGEIAWTDSLVGRVVDELSRLDLSKRRSSRSSPITARAWESTASTGTATSSTSR